MSFNKAKALKTASKYVQQGKYPAAIEEYRKIVQAEPSDITTLNTLGDLCVKVGDPAEAIRSFVRIAEHYRTGGFNLKAIAMFKKVSKLDPANIEIALKLAALYAQQKLMVDARHQYLAVAESYLRAGQNKEALNIYQKIADLDPENTTIKLKLAEAYLREQQLDQAYETFTSVAGELQRQGKAEEALQTYLKALKTNPQGQLAFSAAVNLYIQRGEPQRAVALIKHLLAAQPDDAELLTLLGRVHQSANEPDAAEEAIARAVELEPGRFQYLLDLASFFTRSGELDRALSQLDRIMELLHERREEEKAIALLHEVVARDANHFGALRRLAAIYSRIREDHNLIETLNSLADAAIRKGEDEVAINALQQLMQLEPDEIKHRRRLRSLGLSDEDLQRLNSPSFAQAETHPAMSAAPAPNIPEFEVTAAQSGGTRADFAVNGFEAAAEVPAAPVAMAAPAGEGLEEFEVSVPPTGSGYDFAFSEGEMVDGNESEAQLWGQTEAEEGLGFETLTPEIDLSDDLIATSSQSFLNSYLNGDDETQRDLSQSVGREAEPVIAAEEIKAVEAPTGELDLGEELASIDFFISQGMLEVAREMLESLAVRFPAHPKIQAAYDRLAAEGAAPGATTNGHSPMTGGFSLSLDPSPESVRQADGWGSDLEPEGMAAGSLPQSELQGEFRARAFESEPVDEQEEETIFIIPVAPSAAEDFIPQMALPAVEVEAETQAPQMNEATTASLSTALTGTGTTGPLSLAAPTQNLPVTSPFDDLLDELNVGSFDLEDESPTPTATQPSGGSDAAQAGNDELFDILDEFKSGAEQAASVEDFETHYNLGLAYKEMEMFDDAIEEFQQGFKATSAQPSSQHYLLCCSMLGFCFMQKDLPRLAVMWFKKGLDAPGRTEDEYQALRYDLATAYAALGDLERAYDTFSEVYAIDVNYRGVTVKMSEIQEQMTAKQ